VLTVTEIALEARLVLQPLETLAVYEPVVVATYVVLVAPEMIVPSLYQVLPVALVDVSVTLPPVQNVVAPPALTVGGAGAGLTVIAALPLELPLQLALSLTVETVYVVFDDGETDRCAGLAATPLCVTPSDQTTVHGPEPVRVAEIVVEFPSQIEAVPLTVAVGGAAAPSTWTSSMYQPVSFVAVQFEMPMNVNFSVLPAHVPPQTESIETTLLTNVGCWPPQMPEPVYVVPHPSAASLPFADPLACAAV
jgi:hypothetical protein